MGSSVLWVSEEHKNLHRYYLTLKSMGISRKSILTDYFFIRDTTFMENGYP